VTQVLVERIVHGDGASDDVGEMVAIERGRKEVDVPLRTRVSWHLNKPTTKPPVIHLESLDAKGAWKSFGSFETIPGETVEVVMALAAAPYSLRLRWACEPPERSLHWELRAWV
jgi:hypothetical protein